MRSLRLVLLLSMPLLGGNALAQGLVWQCWYDGQIHVTCTVEQAPPEFVFPYRYLNIPLHNQPTDMEMVRVLARSVACAGQRECAASFSPQPPEADLLAKTN